MKTTNHQMVTIKIGKNPKMKVIRLNKNGKARQPRKSAAGSDRAGLVQKILDRVTTMVDDTGCGMRVEPAKFEELEEMLWKLANGR